MNDDTELEKKDRLLMSFSKQIREARKNLIASNNLIKRLKEDILRQSKEIEFQGNKIKDMEAREAENLRAENLRVVQEAEQRAPAAATVGDTTIDALEEKIKALEETVLKYQEDERNRKEKEARDAEVKRLRKKHHLLNKALNEAADRLVECEAVLEKIATELISSDAVLPGILSNASDAVLPGILSNAPTDPLDQLRYLNAKLHERPIDPRDLIVLFERFLKLLNKGSKRPLASSAKADKTLAKKTLNQAKKKAKKEIKLAEDVFLNQPSGDEQDLSKIMSYFIKVGNYGDKTYPEETTEENKTNEEISSEELNRIKNGRIIAKAFGQMGCFGMPTLYNLYLLCCIFVRTGYSNRTGIKQHLIPDNISGYAVFKFIVHADIQEITINSSINSPNIITFTINSITINVSAGNILVQGAAMGTVLSKTTRDETTCIVVEAVAGVTFDDKTDIMIQTRKNVAELVTTVLLDGGNVEEIGKAIEPLVYHLSINQHRHLTLTKKSKPCTGTKEMWENLNHTGNVWSKMDRAYQMYVAIGSLLSHLVNADVVDEARRAVNKTGHTSIVIIGEGDARKSIPVDLFSFLPYNTQIKLRENIYDGRRALFTPS